MGSKTRQQIASAKEPYQRDYILQKRPMILRSLLIVATPYRHMNAARESRYIYKSVAVVGSHVAYSKCKHEIEIHLGTCQ